MSVQQLSFEAQFAQAAYAMLSVGMRNLGQVLPFAIHPHHLNAAALLRSPQRRFSGARLRSAAAIKRLMRETDRPSSAAIWVM